MKAGKTCGIRITNSLPEMSEEEMAMCAHRASMVSASAACPVFSTCST
jgi:hypothetical protein